MLASCNDAEQHRGRSSSTANSAQKLRRHHHLGKNKSSTLPMPIRSLFVMIYIHVYRKVMAFCDPHPCIKRRALTVFGTCPDVGLTQVPVRENRNLFGSTPGRQAGAITCSDHQPNRQSLVTSSRLLRRTETTATVAHKMGRRWFAVEVSKHYARLSAATSLRGSGWDRQRRHHAQDQLVRRRVYSIRLHRQQVLSSIKSRDASPTARAQYPDSPCRYKQMPCAHPLEHPYRSPRKPPPRPCISHRWKRLGLDTGGHCG